MLRAVTNNKKLSCPVLSCSLTKTGEWCEMGCPTLETGFKNWSYFVLLKILFDIKLPFGKIQTETSDLLEQLGYWKCVFTLCALVAVLIAEGREYCCVYWSLGNEELTVGWILYEVGHMIFFFNTSFTPWSGTLKENHKVFVHLFLWSFYLDINWHS